MARRTSTFGKIALTWAWLALVVGVVAVVLIAVAGPLYRHETITLGAAFDLLHKGFWVGIVAAAAAAVGLIATLLARRHFAVVIALVALVLGIVAFGWPWMLLREARAAPPIHDITTNPAAPPQFIALAAQRKSAPNGLAYAGSAGGGMGKAELGALSHFFASPAGRASPGHDAAVKACTSWGPACLAAVQDAYYADIRPLLAPGASPTQAYDAALATAKGMGWKIAAADAASHHIEASATTSWFGFTDDIAIDVSPNGSGSVVNIRSESRLGLSDVGMNAKRVRAYLRRLQKRLPGSRM